MQEVEYSRSFPKTMKARLKSYEEKKLSGSLQTGLHVKIFLVFLLVYSTEYVTLRSKRTQISQRKLKDLVLPTSRVRAVLS